MVILGAGLAGASQSGLGEIVAQAQRVLSLPGGTHPHVRASDRFPPGSGEEASGSPLASQPTPGEDDDGLVGSRAQDAAKGVEDEQTGAFPVGSPVGSASADVEGDEEPSGGGGIAPSGGDHGGGNAGGSGDAGGNAVGGGGGNGGNGGSGNGGGSGIGGGGNAGGGAPGGNGGSPGGGGTLGGNGHAPGGNSGNTSGGSGGGGSSHGGSGGAGTGGSGGAAHGSGAGQTAVGGNDRP
jgi:hypothetical protein